MTDPATNNTFFVSVEVTLHDVRQERKNLFLENAGFCFARHDCAVALDPELFAINMKRQKASSGPAAQYEAEVAKFLKQLTGAGTIVPQVFDGLVARTSVRAESKLWAPPAAFVHLDFTKNFAETFSTGAFRRM